MIKINLQNRISKKELLSLYENCSLHELGNFALEIKRQKGKDKTVTYIVDRNINYSNRCISKCKFCAFYAKTKEDEYDLNREELEKKIKDTIDAGGNQVLIQGGLDPKKNINYYTNLFSLIKSVSSNFHIHGLSPPEIYFLSQSDKISVKEVLMKLKENGLDSIPGGGAEILVNSVREQVSPNKCSADEWLNVMEIAHQLGIKSSATMMFGHVETIEDRIEHLNKIRNLQDKTGGFTAFIPWTYQPGNNELNIKKVSSLEYLKMVALSRIFLDNINNIQASWVTQGLRIAIVALYFGANDMGSTMLEENVIRSTGYNTNIVSEKNLVNEIQKIGYNCKKRDYLYGELND